IFFEKRSNVSISTKMKDESVFLPLKRLIILILPKYHNKLVIYSFAFLLMSSFCVTCVTGGKSLAHVSDFFSTKKGKCFPLKKPAGAKLKIVELDDTIYRDEDEVVNGWGKFYLPNIVKMQVVGVVEGTSCPCDELVLMTCEDKQVYAYDGEELHLVASNLRQVFEEGIKYPASKTYYEGEAFKDMVRSFSFTGTKLGLGIPAARCLF
uniref:Uncharacterized protein n=1 Tax=Mastacembelus armatus TaxID=205130 RepID=A0A3Q3LFA1_9TELE